MGRNILQGAVILNFLPLADISDIQQGSDKIIKRLTSWVYKHFDAMAKEYKEKNRTLEILSLHLLFRENETNLGRYFAAATGFENITVCIHPPKI